MAEVETARVLGSVLVFGSVTVAWIGIEAGTAPA